MHGSGYKQLMRLTTGIRWFYGLILIMASLISLSQVHMITDHVETAQAYQLVTCNPFWVVFVSVIQLLIGFFLLVPYQAIRAAIAGVLFFGYVIVRLWLCGATQAIGINAFLALGLIVLVQLLRFHHTVQPIQK